MAVVVMRMQRAIDNHANGNKADKRHTEAKIIGLMRAAMSRNKQAKNGKKGQTRAHDPVDQTCKHDVPLIRKIG